jgi:hypothetical protein
VKSLALSDVYGRLVRLLNALAVEQDGHQVVEERLTQQDIADRVGASRDMIGKLMKDLVGGGYLAGGGPADHDPQAPAARLVKTSDGHVARRRYARAAPSCNAMNFRHCMLD